MGNPAFGDNVEAYAELMARIRDPLSDRGAVLASAGLTTATLEKLRDQWCVRFASAENAKDLGERFERVFRQAGENARRQRTAGGAAVAATEPITHPADPSPPANAAPLAEPFLEQRPATSEPVRAVEVTSHELAEHGSAPAPLTSAATFVPPAMRHFVNIRETELAVGPPPATPVLPFDPSAQPNPPEPADSSSWVPKGMRHFTSIGETQPAPDEPSGSALPFATATETPRLSLDEHARLCVELALYPAERAAILSRYGLDEEQRQQLAELWGARIHADANLRMSWNNLCAAYRAQESRKR